MSIDLDGAIRRRKPEKSLRQLRARAEAELTFAHDLTPWGPVALVADTNVYINNAGGRLPETVEALLDRTTLFSLLGLHCRNRNRRGQ